LIGGVRVPVEQRVLEDHDADNGQVLDPAADEHEPADPAAKLEFWKCRAVYAPTAYEYERVHAYVLALGGGDQSQWETETLARTVAAQIRGDLRAAEPIAVEAGIEPLAPVKPTTRKVLIKEVLARDSNGDILRVKEYTVEEGIPPEGTSPVDLTRLLGSPSAPPSP
jgi:hypothetical protein